LPTSLHFPLLTLPRHLPSLQATQPLPPPTEARSTFPLAPPSSSSCSTTSPHPSQIPPRAASFLELRHRSRDVPRCRLSRLPRASHLGQKAAGKVL
jgi:hypothetical protein